jgi:hypothetical protein
MEGWRQRRLGWTEKVLWNKRKLWKRAEKLLTGIGLLMEGPTPEFATLKHLGV